MRIFRSFPIFFALFFYFFAPGWAISVEELQEKILKSEAELKGLQFNYVQEMRSDLTPEISMSSGTAYIVKPKSLRIEQVSPEPQTIVTSGKYLYIYTPRFGQVLRNSWKQWVSKNIFFPGLVGFSNTLIELKKKYVWSVIEESNIKDEQVIRVRLTERASSGQAQTLDMWVGATDFIPRKTEFIIGTLKVVTTLSQLELNPKLDESLFNFKQPGNARLIKMP